MGEAIESLEAIAQHPATPYPKHDIEQRANMARNTMRKQLERSIQAQKEYEEKNAEKLLASKQAREIELKKREDARIAAEEAERARKLKIAEERQKILERDRELAEARHEEERAREAAELTTDSETGDKAKRKKKPRTGGAGGKRKMKKRAELNPEDGIAREVVETATRRSPSQRREDWRRRRPRRSPTSSRVARLWWRVTATMMTVQPLRQGRWTMMLRMKQTGWTLMQQVRTRLFPLLQPRNARVDGQ